ncbi:MAG: hypothetical protein CMJ77_14645 [Planctomycetaceae bacterium]|nr:hypothetical protein [Planctomycetaceae bacterium]
MFINRYAWFGVIAMNSALSCYALRLDGRVCLVLIAALSDRSFLVEEHRLNRGIAQGCGIQE